MASTPSSPPAPPPYSEVVTNLDKEMAVPPTESEIIFEVSDDEFDGGFSASALGYGIHTQAETIEEMRDNIREAVECYFDDAPSRPSVIRLHFVRDEVLAL